MLFENLKAFAAVIECESITKAADRLCLTQSAVSRRIQHLEESLGTELFDRDTRPPSPTALAMRIYDSAIVLIRNADELSSIASGDTLPSGRYRIGLVQVIADNVVFETVSILKKTFPGLKIHLITNWASELEKMIVSGNLDVATLLKESPSNLPSGLSGTLIDTSKIAIVQSLKFPLVKRKATLQSLSRHEWILNPKGCKYRDLLESSMKSHGGAIKESIEIYGTEMQMKMVAAGLGLGLVPEKTLIDCSWGRDIKVIDVVNYSLEVDMWIAHSTIQGNLWKANDLLIKSIKRVCGNYQ